MKSIHGYEKRTQHNKWLVMNEIITQLKGGFNKIHSIDDYEFVIQIRNKSGYRYSKSIEGIPKNLDINNFDNAINILRDLNELYLEIDDEIDIWL